MKKILILGSSGLIGHQIFSYLEKLNKYNVLGVSRTNKFPKESILLDVLNHNELESLLKTELPDIVINCVGMLISDSENYPKIAVSLNAEFPHILSEISSRLNFRLIHLSTDCVFSGNKGSSYNEDDYQDATSIYGKTKSLGENISDSHLVIRTSVVGPELTDRKEELFNWFMYQDDEISGYTTAIWSGVTTLELAKKIKEFITLDIKGIYHLTNNKTISKFDLLKLFKKHTKKKIKIKPSPENNLNKSFVDKQKFLTSDIQDYDEMVKEMVSFIKENKKLYSHYDL